MLNDTLVSIPHGSEHFSYKQKNLYEEELYKIEDQRYFYDQTINSNLSVINALAIMNDEISKFSNP